MPVLFDCYSMHLSIPQECGTGGRGRCVCYVESREGSSKRGVSHELFKIE